VGTEFTRFMTRAQLHTPLNTIVNLQVQKGGEFFDQLSYYRLLKMILFHGVSACKKKRILMIYLNCSTHIYRTNLHEFLKRNPLFWNVFAKTLNINVRILPTS
jgi:hypothetical protein